MLIIMSFSSEEEKHKFEYLYEKYKRLLLYKANQILNNYSLAEDAVSEAYIRIYKNLHKIEDPDSNRAISFLMIIVKNTSLTILEKEKKTWGEEPGEEIQLNFNLEDHVISEMSAEKIYILVNKLGEDLKSVFLLRYAHNLSNKEIGRMLHMTENNVGVKLYRAKKKLSEWMEREGIFNESDKERT